MNHLGTEKLETKRLILRRFREDDADAMFNNWASDDEVVKYLTWPAHSSVSVTEEILKKWVENYNKKDYYQWAITLKEKENEPIGGIGVNSYDDKISMVHIGYCIGKHWWHKGITSEALQCVMNFFFEKVKAKRIESRHDPRNKYSGEVMKKCGMKYEGTLRKADKNNQGICDASYYAMLSSDR